MTPAHVSKLADVRLIALQAVPTADALLTIAEFGKQLPFMVQRAFIVQAQQDEARRGRHAHRTTHQFMICVAGAIDVTVYDGTATRTHVLASADQGLHIPPGIWAEQTYRSPVSTLLVLCDALHREGDYIRDYQAFLEFKRIDPGGRVQHRVLNA